MKAIVSLIIIANLVETNADPLEPTPGLEVCDEL